MKKLNLLLMACAVAFMGYAQPWTITYNLEGGVTNPYGWQNESDMFNAFTADVDAIAVAGDPWMTRDEYRAMADPWLNSGEAGNAALGTKLTAANVAALDLPRWQWLRAHIHSVATAQAVQIPPFNVDGTVQGDAQWRFHTAAFLIAGHRAVGWPNSANFTVAGAIDGFQPAWQMGFVGPADYDGTEAIVLPAPFKADHTFMGWFTAPNGGGTNLTTIPAGHSGNLVLYAHFIGAMPTIEEILDTEGTINVGDVVRTRGTATHVFGQYAYIQDATGGIKIRDAGWIGFMFQVGDDVDINATVHALGTTRMLRDVTVNSAVAGTLPTPRLITLPALAANKFRLVRLEGLTVASVADRNVTLTNGFQEVQLVAQMGTMPVLAQGDLLNLVAVVTYDGTTVSLVTHPNNIQIIEVEDVPAEFNNAGQVLYEDMEDGMFSFRNRWLVTSRAPMSNFAAPHNIDGANSRGMVMRDGIIYIPSRLQGQRFIIRVDAMTGAMLPIVDFSGTDVFVRARITEDENGDPLPEEIVTFVELPFNDLKLDRAGNIIASNLVTSGDGRLQVWVIDVDNPHNSRVVINDPISDLITELDPVADRRIRIDYIAVYGDLNNSGYVMATSGNNYGNRNIIFRWVVRNGISTLDLLRGGTIEVPLSDERFNPAQTLLSSTGVIWILNSEHFLVNLRYTPPVMMNIWGEVLGAISDYQGANLDMSAMRMPNGLSVFNLRGEYFMIVPYRPASGTAAGAAPLNFRLIRLNIDNIEDMDFTHITPMWEFPTIGTGTSAALAMVGAISVHVDHGPVGAGSGTATIAIYVPGNGFGVYEFTSRNYRTGTPEVFLPSDVVNMAVEGNVVRTDKPVAQLTVFSVTGQQVVTTTNATSVTIPVSGVFLVRATTLDGQTVTQRVIIR